MTEQKTETKVTEQPQPNQTGVLIENIIKNNDSSIMEKNSSIRINADTLKTLVAKAKKKYPNLNTYLDSDIKIAIVEMIKDFVIENTEKII